MLVRLENFSLFGTARQLNIDGLELSAGDAVRVAERARSTQSIEDSGAYSCGRRWHHNNVGTARQLNIDGLELSAGDAVRVAERSRSTQSIEESGAYSCERRWHHNNGKKTM